MVDHSAQVHEIDNFRALVATLGVASTALPRMKVDVPLIDPLEPRTYAVFHAGSGGYKGHVKEWPEKYWLELGGKLTRMGQGIALTAAPYSAARTEELCAEMRSRRGGRVTNLAGRITLSQTASVAEGARLANAAAGLVVGRVGTATVSAEELLAALNGDWPQADETRRAVRLPRRVAK